MALAQLSPPVSADPGLSGLSFAPGPSSAPFQRTGYDFEGMGSREDTSTAGQVDSVPRSFLSFLGGNPDPSVKGQGR